MTISAFPKQRLGIHYFPDTYHYREQDLQTWLPELKALGVSWLTLIAPVERAIPEPFLRSLIQEGITPLLHFAPKLDTTPQAGQYRIIFENYARWGVQYISLFNLPNRRSSWPAASWAQAELVDRFLDIFIPLAHQVNEAGLKPGFPPLEPGGDYWDTAFLRSALRSLSRRSSSDHSIKRLLDNLTIGACAWTYDRPLDWGAGGPERWPNAHPYHTPLDSQDQIGFRIFDWYLAISQAELGHTLPILLLRAGARPLGSNAVTPQSIDYRMHTENNLAIASLATQQKENPASVMTDISSSPVTEEPPDLNYIPSEVLSLNYWVLSTKTDSEFANDAWYRPDGKVLPVVNAMKQWVKLQNLSTTSDGKSTKNTNLTPNGAVFHPIDHYLLMPLYAWGVADWDLEAIRPFIQSAHPTIGFSIHEASLASHVTVFGDLPSITNEAIEMLRSAGCRVERIKSDGTVLAI